jgi:hypothetical protein
MEEPPDSHTLHPLHPNPHGRPDYLFLLLASIVLLGAAELDAFFINVDVADYQCYALAFWSGGNAVQYFRNTVCHRLGQVLQFHSLPLEYPPLSLAVFSPALLVPARLYPLAFAFCMAFATLLVYWLLLKNGPHRAAVVFLGCLLLGCLATAFARYDIVPAALTLAALILAQRRRWTAAYLVLALGVLIKLYPIAVFPWLFLGEQRETGGFAFADRTTPLIRLPAVLVQSLRKLRAWRWKNTLVFFGLILGASLAFGILDPSGAFSSFSYMSVRPFEVESTGAALAWLTSQFGAPIHWSFSFGSWNVTSPLAGGLSLGITLLLVLGYLWILVEQWRGRMDLVQASLAALLVLVATSKVFSAQYLIWLVPLVAYGASGNRRFLLYWGAISILSTLIYPLYIGILFIYKDPSSVPGFMPVILLRDGLFLVLTFGYLFNFLNLRWPTANPGIEGLPPG